MFGFTELISIEPVVKLMMPTILTFCPTYEQQKFPGTPKKFYDPRRKYFVTASMRNDLLFISKCTLDFITPLTCGHQVTESLIQSTAIHRALHIADTSNTKIATETNKSVNATF